MPLPIFEITEIKNVTEEHFETINLEESAEYISINVVNHIV